MDHGENVRILKTLGFGEAKIRRVLTQRFEEHDNNAITLMISFKRCWISLKIDK